MSRYDLKSNKVLRYSGLATQIFISIGLAAWLGKWIDQKMELSKPLWTAGLSMLMLLLQLVWLNYDLKKLDK
ncbi:MAG: AtpZ/AtpI family protein [Saprospiraceae bacterium]|nr:AtpZ/AtpI family protein [Saprospiraceae bacterium]